MKHYTGVLLVFAFVSGIWSAEPSRQTDVNDAIELINSRLSHSRILKIDADGVVSVKAPGQIIEFPIRAVSFNYNDSDCRVRVAGDYNIRYYKGDRLTEVTHRQSFTCGSRRMAQDAVDSFRSIKSRFLEGDPALNHQNKILSAVDGALGYKTLGQAIDFINDNLSRSVILGLDETGQMAINAPSAIYRIDMKAAHFALKDWSDQAQLRVYGEWCVEVSQEKGRRVERFVPRESFSTHSNSRGRESVEALYYIKGAVLGQHSAQIEEQLMLSRSSPEDYRSIEEAIQYINDRLEISIITGIDEDGLMTVNASEYIYKLPLRDCRFRSGRNMISFFGFRITGRRDSSVDVRCSRGLERHYDGVLQRRIDSESFSARSRRDVKDIIAAFEYIQNKVRKTVRHEGR